MIRTILRPLSRAARAFIGTDGISTAMGQSLQRLAALTESNARLHQRLMFVEEQLKIMARGGGHRVAADVVPVEVPGVGALAFEIHERPDYGISEPLRRHGLLAPDILAVLRQMARAGDTMLDIGANIGWFSVIGSRLVGPQGRVFAVEPDPGNFAILGRNIRRNHCGNVTAHQVAAGAVETTARLYLSPDDNQGDHRMAVASDRSEWVDVPVQRIDALLEKVHRVEVMKMDIQGSEVRALQGMPRLLAASPMLRMVLEFWPYGLAQCGSSTEELATLLSQRPSVLWLNRNDGSLARITATQMLDLARTELSPESQAHADVIAVAAADTEIIAKLDAQAK